MFKIGDRVICAVRKHTDGYDYGELYQHRATVYKNQTGIYLDVRWDRPCGRPDGDYYASSFELVECPW